MHNVYKEVFPVAVICIMKYVFVYSSLTGNSVVHTVMDSKL